MPRAGALAAALAFATLAAARPPPVIDMHLHAHTIAHDGGGADVCFNDERIEFPGVVAPQAITIEAVMRCAHPHAPAANDEAVLRETLAALERHNIVAVTSGPLEQVTRGHAAAPARVIPSISFLADEPRSPEELRQLFAERRFAVFGEIGAQYRGLSLDDPKLEPYWTLAEELDIPVGVHLGEGPPGGLHIGGIPDYRVALGNPLQLEPVLVRHPKLRLRHAQTLCRRGLRQAHPVRLGPDDLARRHRHRDRHDPESAVPHGRAEARHLLQQRAALPQASR